MDFTALLGLCNMLVTSDTMAMHIGIALEKTIIALIGATCEQEIHLYGLGEKIVSDFDCSPCYLQKCNKNPTCMDSITPEQVFESIKRWIPK